MFVSKKTYDDLKKEYDYACSKIKSLREEKNNYQDWAGKLGSENKKLIIEAEEVHLKYYEEMEKTRKLKRENEDLNSEIERLRKKQSEIIKGATETFKLLEEKILSKEEELKRIKDEKAYLDQILSGKVRLQDDRLEERDYSDTKAKIKRDLKIVYIYSQGLTITDTAKVVGLNRSTVSRILKKYREMDPMDLKNINLEYNTQDEKLKEQATNLILRYRRQGLYL